MRRAADRPAASDDWTTLANDIRLVDGNHDLGAGELATRLTERGWTRAPAASDDEDDDLDLMAGDPFTTGELNFGDLNRPAASAGSLDVAWAAAEAALPEGTYIESVRRGWFETPVRYWVRTFRPIHGHNTETRDWPDGPTPIAALARLSESPSEGKTE